MKTTLKPRKSAIPTEIRLLKLLLWLYIVCCIVIAGFNYGFSSKVSPSTAEIFTKIWHVYENQAKTIIIAAAAFLTWRVLRRSRFSAMRLKSLIGFIVAALVVHIVLPLALHNSEVYFFAMPLPWATAPLQLMDNQSGFYLSRAPIWGVAGISSVLVFYVVYSIVIFVGTLLFGRRFQCSSICLFNGFIAEAFAPALPLLGSKKQLGTRALLIATIAKWLFFAGAIFFTAWWALSLSEAIKSTASGTLANVEVYKYLLGELFAAMFFWIAISGRAYCLYCPLGTFLSLIGKVAGQKIRTDNAECIQCGQCNAACPMSIDVKHSAQDATPVKNTRCVGCGHCVDACPTQTLSYSTRFIDVIKNRFSNME